MRDRSITGLRPLLNKTNLKVFGTSDKAYGFQYKAGNGTTMYNYVHHKDNWIKLSFYAIEIGCDNSTSVSIKKTDAEYKHLKRRE